MEARQASLTGEELLHCGPLDGPFLGDKRLEGPDKLIHVCKRFGNLALFRELRQRNVGRKQVTRRYALRAVARLSGEHE